MESDGAADAASCSSSTVSSWHPAAPGRLYCREKEQQQLEQAYLKVKKNTSNKTSQHIVFIKGAATGVGTTTLARSGLRPLVERDGGYFVSGKFDRQNPKPHAVLIAAFTELVHWVVERGTDEVARVRRAGLRDQPLPAAG